MEQTYSTPNLVYGLLAVLAPILLCLAYFFPRLTYTLLTAAIIITFIAAAFSIILILKAKRASRRLLQVDEKLNAMRSKIASLGLSEFGIDVSQDDDVSDILSHIAQVRQKKVDENQRMEKSRIILRELQDIISRHSEFESWEDWSRTAVSKIVKAIDASVSIWYYVDGKMNEDGTLDLNLKADLEKQSVLRPLTSYAFNEDLSEHKTFYFGEGFVGQAALDGEITFLNEVQASNIIISSGLGSAPAKGIAIVPLKTDDIVYGVLELGSTSEIGNIKKEILKSLTEPLALVMKDRMRTQFTDRLREEERERADFEINSLNDMMNFYMESNRQENKVLKEKIKELEAST